MGLIQGAMDMVQGGARWVEKNVNARAVVSNGDAGSNYLFVNGGSDLGNRINNALDAHAAAKTTKMDLSNAHTHAANANQMRVQQQANFQQENADLLRQRQELAKRMRDSSLSDAERAQARAERAELGKQIMESGSFVDRRQGHKNAMVMNQNLRQAQDAHFDQQMKVLKQVPGIVGDYMMGRDYKGRDGRLAALAQRWGVAGGAYMGVNMAGRAVTGGSFAYNNQGERDIAGIPFI